MSNALDRLAQPRNTNPATQTTQVEQSRAVAEVQAAVIVAQQCPRDAAAARDQMLEVCGTQGMAERAFYSVPNRGNGPSVHLARELARIWGNVQYGVLELSRDDDKGQSEIQAFAWDVQTNTRSVRTFIVPHERMTKKAGVRQREKLVDLGDVYLNNQNQGAKAVRECIFTVLPSWFVEEAKEACDATLKHGGGKPLAQRVSDALKAFDGIGVTKARVEARVGRPTGDWTDADVARLIVDFRSIQRGETRADEVFPAEDRRVRAADIVPPGVDPATGELPIEEPPGWESDASNSA